MSSYTYVYNSQLDAFELYHLTQEQNTRTTSLGPALPALGHATSGALGTTISKLITYPLDLVVARLQVQKQLLGPNEKPRYDGILDAIEKIYEREGGLSAFYNGVPQEVFKGVTDSFLFFLAYSYVRQSRLAANGGRKNLGALEEIGVGVVAGAFSKFCTTPIQNIVTRKQTAAMTALEGSSTAIPPASSTKDIAYEIRREKGLQGFWSGYSASLILTLNPSITMLLHKVLLRLLVPQDKRNDPGARVTFLIAATSKALASTITYPFQLAKTRAQVSSQKPTEAIGETSEFEKAEAPLRNKVVRARQGTVFSTIMRIAQTEGFWGLYQGLGGEVLKGFFSHGITMLMKERIHAVIINLYYAVLKSLKKFPTPEELKQMASDEIEHGKERVGEAYTKGVEVAGQAAGKVQEAVAGGSQQAQNLYESGKEQAGDAYNKVAGAAQSASSTAQDQATGVYNKATEAANSATLTAQDQASGSYAKAAETVESSSSLARGKASEVYNKYTQYTDSAPARAQQAATAGSHSAELVERGNDVASHAAEQAPDAHDSYGAQQGVTTGSQTAELVEKGKEVASTAAEQAPDAHDSYGAQQAASPVEKGKDVASNAAEQAPDAHDSYGKKE